MFSVGQISARQLMALFVVPALAAGCLPTLPGSEGASGVVLALMKTMNSAATTEEEEPTTPTTPTTPTVTPPPACGTDCFFSEDVLMSGNIGLGSVALEIIGGADAGKILILHGGGAGPNRRSPGGPGGSVTLIGDGVHDGRVLVIAGAMNRQTDIYDPAAHDFLAGTRLTAVVTGCSSILRIGSGLRQNSLLVLHGASMQTSVYDPTTNRMSSNGVISMGGAGQNTFRITTGPNANQIMIVSGAGDPTTTLYDEASDSYLAGTPSNNNSALAAFNFSIVGGAQDGRQLLANGGGAITTEIYDPVGDAFGAGPDLNQPLAGTRASGVPAISMTRQRSIPTVFWCSTPVGAASLASISPESSPLRDRYCNLRYGQTD